VLLLVELSVALLARAIRRSTSSSWPAAQMLVGVVVLALGMPALVSGAEAIYRFVFQAASGGAVSA